MLICNVGLLSGVGKEDRISIRHPQIPRPWNPIRATPRQSSAVAYIPFPQPCGVRRVMTGTEYTEREETPLEESRRKGQGNTPVAVYDSFSILRPITVAPSYLSGTHGESRRPMHGLSHSSAGCPE